jgi:hypothetical protein
VDAATAAAASPLGAAPEEPHAVKTKAAQHTIARRTPSPNERNCKLMHICRFPSCEITLIYRSNSQVHSWPATVPINRNFRKNYYRGDKTDDSRCRQSATIGVTEKITGKMKRMKISVATQRRLRSMKIPSAEKPADACPIARR